jgi:signal transduction histidine kinase
VSLTRRLALSYVAVVAVAAGTLVVAADVALRRRLTREAARELEREALYLRAAARGLPAAALDSLVHELGRATGRRLTVVDRAGAVIADSDFPRDQLATLENHATRPEIVAAYGGRVGTDLRRSASSGRWELKVALPSEGGSVVRVASPLPQVDAMVARAQGAVLVGALIALVVSLVLAMGFARGVARPMLRLRESAQAIARGEHPAVDARGRDEVGELARALRAVDEQLGGRLAELERERSETAALIASMVEGVIACDERGRITALNPAARRLLNLGPEDSPPPAQELFRQPGAHEAVAATLAGGTTAGLEVELDNRSVLLSGQGLSGGGAVFVVHDVTQLKRLEAVRRDFVANVSHELKTPLTVVRGYAETLLKDDPPPELRRGFLESMLGNARRMQHLIDDLLDLSRIESRAWRPEPDDVALPPLVDEVWASVSASEGAGRHEFVRDVPQAAATVRADREALRQILANVLDNAARYTPSGGRVRVSARREEGALRLEVEDTGPGIPSEHLPRIFERFYRVDPARSRELGGTGLGLAIVKHLVEAHGGKVEAASALGRGTTIRIQLPVPAAGDVTSS